LFLTNGFELAYNIKYIKLLLHKKAAITRTTAFIKNDIAMCVGLHF